MSRTLMLASTLLLCATFLSGCAGRTDLPKVTVKERLIEKDIPDYLLTCKGKPKVPSSGGDVAVASYVAKLDDAHSDCAGKVGAIRKLSKPRK